MTQIFKPNTKGYKVLTPNGYQAFSGISLMGYKSIIRLDLENNNFIECTSNHKIYVSEVKAKQACRIKIGEDVLTNNGSLKLLSRTKTKDTVPVYDLIGVENGARYYANSVLVSNCKPIIFEETLISPMRLLELTSAEPVEKQGQVRWFKKPAKGKIYAVGLDPSLGTGGDNAAIQIVQLPELLQIGEWVNNRTPIEKQVYIMKEIINYIAGITESEHSTYYSVENNTLGEAALVSINAVGEENIKGIFLSEPKKMGQTSRYRKGFTTTNKSKLAACAKLKSLVENRKLAIASKGLITELKCFIASGNSFEAKLGETDDLVMSLILVIRMIQLIQNFDADIDNALRDTESDWIEPLPFVVVFN